MVQIETDTTGVRGFAIDCGYRQSTFSASIVSGSVTFAKPFKTIPRVVVSTYGLNNNMLLAYKPVVSVINVYKTGFDFNAVSGTSPSTSMIAGFNWIAIGS